MGQQRVRLRLRGIGRACRRRVDWSSDAGFAGGGEVIPFGMLVFVMGTLMITNLWGVIDTKMATNGAAREAARVVAESDGPGADPAALGRDAAEASLTVHGRDAGRLDYGLVYGTGGTGAPAGAWAPCARARVTVSYPLALINLPFLGIMTGEVVTVTSTHSEIVDPYRSRATDPGDLQC
jgi:hypothetical protein